MPTLVSIGQFWLLLAVIVGASLFPLPSGTLRGGLDKWLHLVTYLFLIVSLDYAYVRGRKLVAKFILLLACSWLIEIAQLFLASRKYSPGDLLANLAGLFLGLALILVLKKLRPVVAVTAGPVRDHKPL